MYDDWCIKQWSISLWWLVTFIAFHASFGRDEIESAWGQIEPNIEKLRKVYLDQE